MTAGRLYVVRSETYPGIRPHIVAEIAAWKGEGGQLAPGIDNNLCDSELYSRGELLGRPDGLEMLAAWTAGDDGDFLRHEAAVDLEAAVDELLWSLGPRTL